MKDSFWGLTQTVQGTKSQDISAAVASIVWILCMRNVKLSKDN